MGERVVVGRATPVEPIDDSSGGVGGGGEPLNYGRADRTGDAWRWAHAWGAALLEGLRRLGALLVSVFGGWQRVLFALGLGCLLGGIGVCLDTSAPRGTSDGGFWMFIGGLLIGLTVRVPLRET